MYRTLLTLVTLAPSVALADAPELDPSWEPSRLQQAEGGSAPVSTVVSPRGYDMEIGFRGRVVSVPDSILDIWYFNADSEGWAAPGDRPSITGYALGLEFVVKGETANGIFYFDYMASTMDAGYWDDREQPPDHLDGDYVEPSDDLGLVAFGANYAYEAHMVRTADTDGVFGLSFLVGGGLGVGVLIGDLYRWGPQREGTFKPAFQRYNEGDEPDGTQDIPGVYPIVDLNAGLRFNFGDRVMLRVEGGLHTLVYYGASLGMMF